MLRQLYLALVLILGLVACGQQQQSLEAKPKYEWVLITSWPKSLPGLGAAPDRFAEEIHKLSHGQISVKVYGAGELYPALEVFDAVSEGKVQIGHSAAYYWQDKLPSAPFFTSVPFGMTAQEHSAWLALGGGLELWRDLYRPYNLIPFAGGNTDAQMGGWFNREINSIEDLDGLTMRLPGLGGEVLKLAGGNPVNLPGGQLFTALKNGTVEAVEWVGAYNDLALGLYKAAKYYYYPGWHEPSTTLEFIVNRDAYEELPRDLQVAVQYATKVVHQETLHEYMINNVEALDVLANEHGVELREFPKPVLAQLEILTHKVLKAKALSDPQFQATMESYQRFLFGVKKYNQMAIRAN